MTLSRLALATFLATPLMASLPVAADAGAYLTAAVGSAELSDDFDGFDVDADSTAYRVNAGWRFNEHFALEGGYQNFGRFTQNFTVDGAETRVALKADGFTFGVVGSLPLASRWSLFARAGAFFWDGNADINNVTQATPEETNVYLGAGLRYGLFERFSLTADGSRYDLDGTASTVFSLGMEFSF